MVPLKDQAGKGLPLSVGGGTLGPPRVVDSGVNSLLEGAPTGQPPQSTWGPQAAGTSIQSNAGKLPSSSILNSGECCPNSQLP